MSSTGTYVTLAGALWAPGKESSLLGKIVRPAALMLAGSLLLAISAQIFVPIGPVPVTMQNFAVLLISAAFGWRLGAATMALYLAEGAMGLPVFAGGGSLASLAGPTAGYLFSYVLVGAVVGALAERGWDQSFLKSAIAMLIGTALIYAGGLSWLSQFTGFEKAIEVGMMPFILVDLVKAALVVAVLPTVWKLIHRLRS